MNLGTYISTWKTAKGITSIELSQAAGVDQALLSKYENGKRLPSEKHLRQLAEAMAVPISEIRKEFLVDKIAELIKYEQQPLDILMAAETRMEYLLSEHAFKLPKLSKEVESKLKKIDKLKEKWHSNRPLNATQLKKMEEYFDTRYTYESNRIEGNTLTYQETHLVVAEGLTIGGKSMTEHLEVINHAEAISWLKDLVAGKEEVSKRSVLDMHRLVLKSIDSANAGRYRTVPVMISGSEHVPPQPYLLEKLMEDYFSHYERNRRVLHPVLLAAEMHERLLSIHPFIDGNGRTSRLLMNFILLKNGYTIANLKGDHESKQAYYSALQNAQVDNKPELFYTLIIDRVIDSLEQHLAMV